MDEPDPDSASESDSSAPPAPSTAVGAAVEVAIRLGAIALLVGWCLVIIAPFLDVVVWALIIAIAADSPFEWLCARLGGRRRLAGVLGVSVVLFALAIPTAIFSETLFEGAQSLARGLREGLLRVPEPEPWVRDLPLVGDSAYELWLGASENLGQVLRRFAPQLQAASRWLLGQLGGVSTGLVEIIGSILIAGFMLVRAETRQLALRRFAHRMAGVERGTHLLIIATATIRSVVQGIVGVAAIQSVLAGVGFLVAGVPGAGLWALLVLVAAVIQIPVLIGMIVPVVVGFQTLSPTAAIALLVWCVIVGAADNVLKPILFGRGASVPSLVIFMGAIGGLFTMGIVGLFLGAAVLALGFELFRAWLEADELERVRALGAAGAAGVDGELGAEVTASRG